MEFNYQSLQDKLKSYVPSLDGLRAIAIIWVMLHNGALDNSLDMQSLSGKIIAIILNTGWMGVQIFFVLSGFLITGILIDAKRNKTADLFKQFYMRRILRIFPVYYTFLILAFIVALILPDIPVWLQNAYNHKWWHIFYISNWIQPFESVGFGHFWSLAIEEQYYLFWPLVIIMLSYSRLYLACVIMIVISVVFRFAITAYDLKFAESAAYVLTLARLDALAMGSLLAIVLRDKALFQKIPKIALTLLALSGFYLLVTLLSQHSLSRVSSGWTSLNQTMAAVFFMTIIYYCLDLKNIASHKAHIRLLSLSWLRSVGKYSYAMYIFHAPISLLLHAYLSASLLSMLSFMGDEARFYVFIIDLFLLFLFTYLLAWCSWRIIEQPFLKLKRFYPMNRKNISI